MSDQKIPIKEARVYWNSDTGEVAVGTIDHPATKDSARYPSWICVKTYEAHTLECVACLFGELLWLWERQRINLKAALQEIRKIEGVTEWLDNGRVWI